MKAAVDTYNADIITMSYGGWGSYHDGTREDSQAVDYASSKGAVVFTSAGNKADDDEHYSGTVGATSTTGYIRVNVTGAGYHDTALFYNLVWYDGLGIHNNLTGQFYDSGYNPLSTINDTRSESTRGTEARYCYYGPSPGYFSWLPSGSGTYYIKVTNNSAASQDFHIYVMYGWAWGGSVTFQNPDPNYTITSPADADSAIAVGAYTTRTSWYDYNNGGPWQLGSGQTLDQITTFSSRGPRVDSGAPPKPNILAPGAYIISARDNDVYPWPGGANAFFIDNDGPNENSATKNDGNGPADYYMMQGTSMASPMAAGAAALLLEAQPGLKGNPTAVRDRLQQTASKASSPDNIWGYGLIDVHQAVAGLPAPPSVTTNNASNITTNSATLNGTLDDLGTASTAYVSFEYGLTTAYGNETTPQAKTSTGPFSFNLSGLSPDTTRHFRAKAVGNGTSYGLDKSFATSEVGVASVSIEPSSQTVPAGGYFNVYVVVDSGGTPITACNVTVTFDPDLTATGVTGADLLGTAGLDALYLPTIDVGEVSYGGARIDGPIAVNGDFVTIDFDVAAAATGTYPLVVAATLLDAAGNPIAVVENDGEVVIGVPVPLVSIAASPTPVTMPIGETQQLTITATYDDASTADVTGTSTYVSDDETVATVSTGGLITAVGAGSATVSVSYTEGAITETATVAVTITPAAYSEIFTDGLAKGERETLAIIPGGVIDLEITLTATADIDLELYDGDIFVIGWKVNGTKARIYSRRSTTDTYEGDTFAYSGYKGVDGYNEYINADDGPLGRPYTLKVFGYKAGTYTVTVSYTFP